MPDVRQKLLRLASEALADPSRAQDYARDALLEIDRMQARRDVAPEGYVYAGAHTWIAQVDQLVVEPLPSGPNDRTGVPIWTTSNEPIPIRVPFDAWIFGVAAWAIVVPPAGEENPWSGAFPFLSTALEGRQIFTTDWDTDGQNARSSDGIRRMMAPASSVCGTRRRPRALSWRLQRNQQINVRFRSMLNAIVTDVGEAGYIPITRAAVAFYAVNLERP